MVQATLVLGEGDASVVDPIITETVDKDGKHYSWAFWCPGCEEAHQFKTPPWTFNRSMTKPTVRASILVRGGKGSVKGTNRRCHLYVTDGQIKFLTDCTHALKGQTVPMVPMPWEDEDDG